MSRRPEDLQATFCATLVDEWARCGLRHAVVAPGSRSTPLALALADDERISVHVHHDERSAGFLALGIGAATGAPAVVLTTSGTAAVELHPAVVEADLAAVPLLACTADRPPELRDVGAPQAMDQTHLYGRATRWFHDPGVATGTMTGRWRALAARALAATLADRPGPVHLNLPFREPLVGRPGPLPPGRPGGGPWVRAVRAAATPTSSEAITSADPRPATEDLPGLVGRRGLLVAGAGSGPAAPIEALAESLGWPVLADVRAAVRRPSGVVVAHTDAILRHPEAAEALRPEVVVHLGDAPASRVLGEWLAGAGAEEVVIAGPRRWRDPHGTARVVIDAHPDQALPALLRTVVGDPAAAGPVGDGGWLQRWRSADAAAATAIQEVLAAAEGPTEPGVARSLYQALPEGTRLVVSSSMPIRDLEWYAPPCEGLVVHANRGANGIDGVTSTAVGVAVGSGAPTAALLGDVAFLHDVNGLLGAAGRGIDLVVVVVDNDGGGIFSFLPQASLLEPVRFEQLLGTPHGLDLVAVAAAHGVVARWLPGDQEAGPAAAAALADGGVQALVVRTDRVANVELHRRLGDAAAAAAARALADPG
jgi:2-succinyl-5-enolpyruvyl-6-hydroxy-3-cyclohexene-1-carboxylate synthase